MPEIEKLVSFYDSSHVLMGVFKEIVVQMCNGDIGENLEEHNATSKLLADVLCYGYDFDQKVITISQVQNDFAYYKRVLSRIKTSTNSNNYYTIHSSKANDVSLFFARFSPLTSCFAKCCNQLLSTDNNDELRNKLMELFSKYALLCHSIVCNVAYENLSVYCVKVLASSIVLYDNVDPTGAYVRSSRINVYNLVKGMLSHHNGETLSALSFITRTSPNFNSPSTPKVVKSLIKHDPPIDANSV